MIDILSDKRKKIILEEYLIEGLKSFSIIGVEIYTVANPDANGTKMILQYGHATQEFFISIDVDTCELKTSVRNPVSPIKEKVNELLISYRSHLRNKAIDQIL